MAECRPHPGMPGGPCCCRFPEAVARCQPTPEKVHGTVQQQFFRDCGKSQHTSGTRFHPYGPCPSTSKCGCLLGSAGYRWLQQFLPNVLPAVEPLFPLWPENFWTPLCSWGFALPTRHCQVWSCRVAAFAFPLFTVLVEFKPSPFSFLPF